MIVATIMLTFVVIAASEASGTDQKRLRHCSGADAQQSGRQYTASAKQHNAFFHFHGETAGFVPPEPV